jgi:hypothetical protein
VLYALPLGLSLSLVALRPIWSRVLFVLDVAGFEAGAGREGDGQ